MPMSIATPAKKALRNTIIIQLIRMVMGPPQAVVVNKSSIMRAIQPTAKARKNLKIGCILHG